MFNALNIWRQPQSPPPSSQTSLVRFQLQGHAPTVVLLDLGQSFVECRYQEGVVELGVGRLCSVLTEIQNEMFHHRNHLSFGRLLNDGIECGGNQHQRPTFLLPDYGLAPIALNLVVRLLRVCGSSRNSDDFGNAKSGLPTFVRT